MHNLMGVRLDEPDRLKLEAPPETQSTAGAGPAVQFFSRRPIYL
jgi:hypothetical protein